MGWVITLKSNKKITSEEVNTIVTNLPKDYWPFSGLFEPKTTDWGWSAVTDIHHPVGNELMISGSYGISGDNAEPMAEYMKEKLQVNGHTINIKYHW